MAFERVRKIGKNSYLYGEVRWREGGKVRSRSTYIRRVDNIVRAHLASEVSRAREEPRNPGAYLAEKMQAESDKHRDIQLTNDAVADKNTPDDGGDKT